MASQATRTDLLPPAALRCALCLRASAELLRLPFSAASTGLVLLKRALAAGLDPSSVRTATLPKLRPSVSAGNGCDMPGGRSWRLLACT